MNKIYTSVIFIIMYTMSIMTVYSLDYDYTSTKAVLIKLSPMTELSTKEGIIEGEKINLRVLNDIYYNNKLLISKGTIASAKVGTVITAGMNGFPAEIILDNFEIPGTNSSKIISNYSKVGQNRCYWVYPLKWALTPIPPTGSLTNFIYGGHAKLKTTDIVEIYYYPNWK